MLLGVNSLHRLKDSSTSTSTSPDHFLYVKVSRTCWRALTDSPGVWSITDARYVGVHNSQNISRRMDLKIWSTRKSDDRPRTLVWIWNILKIVATSGHQEYPHYSEPSQENGMVERLQRSLKASLGTELTSTKWLEHLPLILLGLRTTLKQELNCSAEEACMEQHCGYQHSISLTPHQKKLWIWHPSSIYFLVKCLRWPIPQQERTEEIGVATARAAFGKISMFASPTPLL